MNAAYLHIALVHLPVIMTPLGALLLAIAHLRGSLTVARVALGILIAASVIAVPVFLLGEPAEEIVEHLPGISEHLIEEHEEAAELALWCSIATGLLGLATWFAISIGAALERALLAITFLASSLASLALGYTAHQGGKIRHPEAFGLLQPQQQQAEHNEHD
jgi:hypothetical protein